MIPKSKQLAQRKAEERFILLRWTLLIGLTGTLQGCALGPALQDLGLLDAPPEEPKHQARLPSPKRHASLEAHRFALDQEDDVIGALGIVPLREGDTLPDVARHFGVGYGEIAAANPGVDPWLPKPTSQSLLPLQFVLPRAPRRGIVINLAAMRLFHFPAEARGTEVVTYPVGIGKEGRSTPMGAMWIARKKEHPTWYPTQNIRNHHRQKGDLLPAAVLPGPDNPLGEYAMYLSRQPYLIHGTNKPYSIGWRASNGCIRLYPENIEQLFPTVSAKEPVTIVNQPYLVGWHQGRVYLQAHRPHSELDGRVLQQRLRGELKRVATESAQPLDWAAIDRTLAEARGVPMPVSGKTLSTEQVLAQARPVDRPSRFLGQPETPSGATDGWHVMAAESVSESTARRLAAFLNHQGPQIPARTVLRGKHYQVVAGPYADARSAAAAVKRLQADLDMEGRVVAPNERLADGTVR